MAHRKHKVFSIGTKTALLSMLLVVVTSGGVGITFYLGSKNALVKQELEKTNHTVEMEIARFNSEITGLSRDVMFISRVPPVPGIIRARGNAGIDPVDGSTSAEWTKRLSLLFTGFLETKPQYLQVRLIGIDDGGREIVRVERGSKNIIKAVEDAALQQKGQREYFQEAINNNSNEVYLSPIEFNREHGKYSEPLIRVIRAAVPVYRNDGEVFGIVIINMNADEMLNRLRSSFTDSDTKIYITDEYGRYIPDVSNVKKYNPDAKPQRYIYNDFPDVTHYFAEANARTRTGLKSKARKLPVLISVNDVAHSLIKKGYGLRVVVVSDFASIENKVNTIRSTSIFLVVVLLVSGGMVSVIFSRRLIRSIATVTNGIVAFSRGDTEILLPETNDEFGILANAFRDMKKQLEARESELRDNEQRFALTIMGSKDGIWDWNLQTGEIYLSTRYKSMLGYGDDEIGNDFLSLQKLIHPDDFPFVLDTWLNCMDGGENNFNIEYRMLTKQKDSIWVQCRGIVLCDSDREPVRMAGSQTDITERKEAQDSLQRARSRLQFLVDNMPGVVYSAAPSGDYNINFISENVKKILGYTANEVMADYNFWYDHIHQDDVPKMFNRLANLFEENEQVHEYRFLRNDGSYCWVQDTINVIYSESGELTEVVGCITDITDLKKMEQELRNDKAEQALLIEQLHDAQDQLLQSEKMASIGQLAAGIAHEINNPVGYINSNIGSLKHYVSDILKLVETYEQAEENINEPDTRASIQRVKEEVEIGYLKEDIRDLINESEEGVMRVRQIVQDLKDFSHVDEVEWQWADLHQGINSTLNVVNNEIKYKADIIKDFGNLPQVECLISQLNQVFMNILVNATHAMEENKMGTITIRTGCEGDGVWIEITDSGKGMDSETQKRIFEPFFTTKPVGKGTGLGLSLSYNIIQKHRGLINVESEIGEGTRFRVWLPIQQQEQRAVG